MQGLMLLMAKEMPEEMLIDELEQAVLNYKLSRSKETRDKLGMYTMLMAARIATEGRETFDALKDFSEKESLLKAFDGTKLG